MLVDHACLAKFERSIIRERTCAGLAVAQARGRTGGRPPALTERDKSAAVALLRDPDIPVKEVVQRRGISVTTLYQHFPSGRGALQDAGRRTELRNP